MSHKEKGLNLKQTHSLVTYLQMTNTLPLILIVALHYCKYAADGIINHCVVAKVTNSKP